MTAITTTHLGGTRLPQRAVAVIAAIAIVLAVAVLATWLALHGSSPTVSVPQPGHAQVGADCRPTRVVHYC